MFEQLFYKLNINWFIATDFSILTASAHYCYFVEHLYKTHKPHIVLI